MAHVFLDLDGTLTDPKPGITGAVQHALKTLGLPVPSVDELEWVIGPPLLQSFERLGAADPEKALKIYREKYTNEGLFDAEVYNGIPKALCALSEIHDLFLATAKPHIYAKRITAYFRVDCHLRDQFGPELDGTRNDKAELLTHAGKALGISMSNSLMVGDRHLDLKAARANGMKFIGALWGYGSQEELEGADVLCTTPCELPDAIAGLVG